MVQDRLSKGAAHGAPQGHYREKDENPLAARLQQTDSLMSRSMRVPITIWFYAACFVAVTPLLVAEDRSPAALEADAVLMPARSVKLSLPMEATLRELRVKEGEFVKKGDVLAVLYSPAESLDRDRADKQRELAEFEFKMNEKLRADAIVSVEQAQQKKINHDVAAIEALRARAILADKTLVAPFDGCVLRIFKEEGETVARVDKIVEMVDFATLYAESYLESSWLGVIRRGSTAHVVIPQLGNQKHQATVENVDPVADPASGLFRVRLVLDNSDYAIPSGVPAKALFTPGSMLGSNKPAESEPARDSN
jgi:RND family efflux transporter MFP subunit